MQFCKALKAAGRQVSVPTVIALSWTDRLPCKKELKLLLQLW